MSRRRLPLVALFLALAFLLAAVATHSFWLGALGNYLVDSQAPVPSEVIIVLAGDFRGERVLKAAELARQGYAPKILLGGSSTLYGNQESDLALAFITARGYPASLFTPLVMTAKSTAEEASFYRDDLKARNLRRVLLVTSNYHTRRALEIFRRVLGADFEVHVVAAPDAEFEPASWWRTREGRKVAFIEGSKTLAVWFGGG